MKRTKPFVIFGVNADDNPYEDINRQNQMIDFLVGFGARFDLGAVICNGTVTPIFFTETPDVVDTNRFKELLIEGKQTGLLQVDQLRNVWVHFNVTRTCGHNIAAVAPLGTFVEIDAEQAGKEEWVIYRHNEDKYYKIDKTA